MNLVVQDALNSLVRLRLRCIGRAANLLWVHFGEWHEIPNRNGGTRMVGDWALHIQCPWRFNRGSRILVASRDFNDDGVQAKSYDWNAGGLSKFDRLAATFNTDLEVVDYHVLSVTCDALNGFRLAFPHSLAFDVFPHAAASPPKHEFWRLFQPSNQSRHFVVDNDESELAC